MEGPSPGGAPDSMRKGGGGSGSLLNEHRPSVLMETGVFRKGNRY